MPKERGQYELNFESLNQQKKYFYSINRPTFKNTRCFFLLNANHFNY